MLSLQKDFQVLSVQNVKPLQIKQFMRKIFIFNVF